PPCPRGGRYLRAPRRGGVGEGRLSLGLYLVVLPGARGWLAVAAHHIHHPQEQGVAAQPAQPQSHRGKGRGVTPSRCRHLPSPWQRRRRQHATRPARLRSPPGPAHTLGAERAAPRQRGPAGRLRCDTPGPPAPSLSLANRRAGGAVARHGPPRGALLSNRSGAGWRRRLVRTPPSSRLRSPAGSAGGPPAPPNPASAGLAPAPSGAHVLGAALSPALRVRQAAGAGGAGAPRARG
uniref:Uncharacterized protein n=1 Tax=Strix occidentalis caurina TaxID=311401 RepID=A0A8D0ET48_STROC